MHRVCHVQVLPLMAGAQRSMLEILRHLDRDTFEPIVVCQTEGPLTDELDRLSIRFHLVPEFGRSIHPWRDVRAYKKLGKFFREEGIDLVHNHSAKCRFVAGAAARHAGVPRIVHHIRCYSFHDNMSKWKHALYRKFERCAARWCDATIFVNQTEHRAALAAGFVDEANSSTIYNGVDLERFSPEHRAHNREQFRRQHGISDDQSVIFFAGRLEEPKQPLIFPEIASRLKHLSSGNWRLVLCGDGTYEASVRSRVTELGLDNDVQFLGWQPSLDVPLHASDVVLLPSIWEGCPRILLEAHAAGLPTVASDIPGIREVVEPNRTGVLVDTRDPSGYAAALNSLIGDRHARERMGHAARTRAEAYFDTRHNNSDIISQYYDLLGIESQATPQPLPHAA